MTSPPEVMAVEEWKGLVHPGEAWPIAAGAESRRWL